MLFNVLILKNFRVSQKSYLQNFMVMLGDQWPKVFQRSPKCQKFAQTAQDNLDGPMWSENLVSQHHPKNSRGNFFVTPLRSVRSGLYTSPTVVAKM